MIRALRRGQPTWASLDEVRRELDFEAQAQLKRAESADARAGVLLAAAGALAGLAANAKTAFVLPGAVVAMATAVIAAGVLMPALHHVVDPVNLRRLYVTAPPEQTRQAVLDRRVSDFALNETIVDTKIRRLKCAIGVLLLAITLVVGGVGTNSLLHAMTMGQPR